MAGEIWCILREGDGYLLYDCQLNSPLSVWEWQTDLRKLSVGFGGNPIWRAAGLSKHSGCSGSASVPLLGLLPTSHVLTKHLFQNTKSRSHPPWRQHFSRKLGHDYFTQCENICWINSEWIAKLDHILIAHFQKPHTKSDLDNSYIIDRIWAKI